MRSRCGCPFESLGFTTHVHGIRSYSKLVGEGITLIGNDVQLWKMDQPLELPALEEAVGRHAEADRI